MNKLLCFYKCYKSNNYKSVSHGVQDNIYRQMEIKAFVNLEGLVSLEDNGS